VIVTGGGGGIGAEVARRFASAGYGVVVSDRGVTAAGDDPAPDAANAVTEQIRSAGGRAVAHHGSVIDVHLKGTLGLDLPAPAREAG
jgi:NAD(P)-dependent dehydrogenase (short-subunit alcohol dehydrogenase family)